MTDQEFRKAVLDNEKVNLIRYLNHSVSPHDEFVIGDEYLSEMIDRIYKMGREEMAKDIRILLEEKPRGDSKVRSPG